MLNRRATGWPRRCSRPPAEVTRLTVIKRLVDAGYAIGAIAAPDVEQLRFMLQQAAHPPLAEGITVSKAEG